MYCFIAVLLVAPDRSFARGGCEYVVLGLSLGITAGEAREILLAQGFRERPVRRSNNMLFTNKVQWPPAEVTLSRHQQRLLSKMQNPRQKMMLEKRAEIDPAFRKQLAELPPIPSRADEIDVRITLARNPAGINTPIAQVFADYRFPDDVNGREMVYSPSHKAITRARWNQYCAGVDLSGLRDRRFMKTNGDHVRVCQDRPKSAGHPIQVSLQPIPAARKRACSYLYQASPFASSEYLK